MEVDNWFNFNVRLRLIGLRRSWFLHAIREFQLAVGLRIENEELYARLRWTFIRTRPHFGHFHLRLPW